MRRLSFVPLYIGTALVLLWFHATVSAQTRVGPFEITGFYQYTINPATAHANPNNFTCVGGLGPFPCPPGLQKKAGKPDFLLMRQFLNVNIFGKLNENWSVSLQPRFFHDLTKSADSHFRQYESLPNEFSGNGWMLRGGGNDFKAEIWQAYVDYQKGNLWLRVGKQSIAWGEALGLRVLDTVNPLDLSQFVFFNRIFEEFDSIRIPRYSYPPQSGEARAEAVLPPPRHQLPLESLALSND